METIREILLWEQPEPVKPQFMFEMSRRAAAKNYLVLGKYGFDFDKTIRAQVNSPVAYGSEFKPANILEPLFGRHPFWPRLKDILSNGSDWQLEPISEEARQQDLREALDRGNHKGAQRKLDVLIELVSKDVEHGYGLVLPLRKLDSIPGSLLAPMNIAGQNTIDEFGRIIEKDRLTHDQSFEFSSGTSLNSRVREGYLLPILIGAVIKRLMNWAVAARNKFPGCKIVCIKNDYKSAFRRMHLNGNIVAQTMTQIPELDLAIASLRLTFGGRPNPSEWGAASESITDLANAILHCDEWDPDKLFAPSSLDIPPAAELPDEMPFAEGKELIVDVPVDPRGTNEVYIDDIIGLAVDFPGSGNANRIERAALLAIYTAARALSPNEPIPRETMEARNKLFAEAAAEEIKRVLGWICNFRRLMISLPDDKARAWIGDVITMLETGRVAADFLESSIGRFVNVGMIIPQVHHFLSRLRSLLRRAKKRRLPAPIDEDCKADLRLLKRVLELANDGISMNNLVYRKPTHPSRVDACPFGIGGYSVRRGGIAWRWYLPEELLFRASVNLLEHLAHIVQIWYEILCGSLRKGDCALVMGDSTTSTGWYKKSNFDVDPELNPEGTSKTMAPIEAEVRNDVCRHHALTVLENEIVEYAQWFKGEENVVADSLSRDDDRTDEELTTILKTHCSSQVPEDFKILRLPKEIDSWLTSVLQRLPVKEQLRSKHTRTKIGRGGGGSSGPSQLDSNMTFSSMDSNEPRESNSWVPSPWLSVKDDFPDRLMIPWLRAQSEIPFHMWHRPSETMTARTPHWTRTATLADFYRTSIERLKIKTLRQNSRKLSQASSLKSCLTRMPQSNNEP